jgi:hypothetical protein
LSTHIFAAGFVYKRRKRRYTFCKSTSKGCDRLMGALREDAKYIYTRAIEAVLPDEAVRRA